LMFTLITSTANVSGANILALTLEEGPV
jgi:hypothetical protein